MNRMSLINWVHKLIILGLYLLLYIKISYNFDELNDIDHNKKDKKYVTHSNSGIKFVYSNKKETKIIDVCTNQK